MKFLKVKKICNDWWPTAIVVAVILYATWAPSPVGDAGLPSVPYADKWIHAIFGGGLLGSLTFDYTRRRPGIRCPRPSVMMAFMLAVMAFMTVDEVVQGLLPIGRPSDPFDMMADWVGALVALGVAPASVRAVLRR